MNKFFKNLVHFNTSRSLIEGDESPKEEPIVKVVPKQPKKAKRREKDKDTEHKEPREPREHRENHREKQPKMQVSEGGDKALPGKKNNVFLGDDLRDTVEEVSGENKKEKDAPLEPPLKSKNSGSKA